MSGPTIRTVVRLPDIASPGPDPRLRRARAAVLASVAAAVATTLTLAGIGLLFEREAVWLVLGAIGISAVAVTQGVALHSAVTASLDEHRRRLVVAFAMAAVLSVPLVAPVGSTGPGETWETWAWLGGSILGSVPLLVQRWAAAAAAAASVAVAAGVGWWTDGSPTRYVLIAVSVGLTVALMTGLPLWLWRLLVQAQEGRAAQGRLAAVEERLRFSRDVHDLLGHSLSVIALKAELAARVAVVDPDRAAAEAAEVQALAVSALAQTREAVHGYRRVDLGEQVAAVAQVLRASGLRCTVRGADPAVPADVAVVLAAVLREAGTNVLRHSRAAWCTIDLAHDGNEVRMTVTNDGAPETTPDRHSSGLRGLSERLADAGGALRTGNTDGVFTLRATVAVPR